MARTKVKTVIGEVLHVSKRRVKSGSWAHEILVGSTRYSLFSDAEFFPFRAGDRISFAFCTRQLRRGSRTRYRVIEQDSIELLAPVSEANCGCGYVYVLTNPAMPGLVKIGFTDRSPTERARELSATTGVPSPFAVASSIFVREKAALIERACHAELRHRRAGKEFFQISPDDAAKLIRRKYTEVSPDKAAKQSAILRQRGEEFTRKREEAFAAMEARRGRAKHERSPEFKWKQSGEVLVVLEDFREMPVGCSLDHFGGIRFHQEKRSFFARVFHKQLGPEWLQISILGRRGYRARNEPPWRVLADGAYRGRRIHETTEDSHTLSDAMKIANQLKIKYPVTNRRIAVNVAVDLIQNPTLLVEDTVRENHGSFVVQRASLESIPLADGFGG